MVGARNSPQHLGLGLRVGYRIGPEYSGPVSVAVVFNFVVAVQS